MEMKIVGITVAILVSITVLAGVLMPVLDDATTVNETFTNDTNTLWRMKALENGDTYTFTGATDTWTLNGVDQEITANGQNALLGPNWCVRANGQTRGETISGNLYNTILAVTSESTITFTAQGLGGNATQDLPGYGVDKDGDYTLTVFGQMAAYCNGDSKIVGTGNTAVDNIGMIVHVEATVDDGATFTILDNRGGVHISNVVLSNTKVNYSPVDGFKDLYKVSSVTTDIAFDSTDGDNVTTSHTGSIEYSSVVVPYEVTAERSVHFTDNQNALLAVIPMLVIVAILIGVVALVIRSRLD